MSNTSPGHISTLDTLRGVAAVSVVLFHFGGATLPKVATPITQGAFGLGYLGVQIFFVISGFIIPLMLHRQNYTPRNALTFLGKRSVRLAPPAQIALILTIAFYASVMAMKLSDNNWLANVSVSTVVHNALFTVPFTERPWIVGVFWTLAVEFQFYILLAVGYNLIFKNAAGLILAIIISNLVYFFTFAERVQFFQFANFFWLGGAVFLKAERKITERQFWLVCGFLAGVLLWQRNGTEAAVGLSAALLIAYATIDWRVGRFFGGISYSLYLTHILTGAILEGVLIRLLPTVTTTQRVTIFLLCLTGALAVAWLFSSTVERYFVRLSRWLFPGSRPNTTSRSSPPAAAPAAPVQRP